MTDPLTKAFTAMDRGVLDLGPILIEFLNAEGEQKAQLEKYVLSSESCCAYHCRLTCVSRS